MTMYVITHCHWRQPRRGCQDTSLNVLVGGRQWEYPHQYYYVRSDTTDQY